MSDPKTIPKDDYPERDLGPPAGLEHLESELRSRMSDGHAYSLVAEVVEWKNAAIRRTLDEQIEACARVCDAVEVVDGTAEAAALFFVAAKIRALKGGGA